MIIGPCKIKKCDWREWSTWSATCGDVKRSRSLKHEESYQYDYDCVALQAKEGCQELEKATQIQNVTKNPCKLFTSILCI